MNNLPGDKGGNVHSLISLFSFGIVIFSFVMTLIPSFNHSIFEPCPMIRMDGFGIIICPGAWDVPRSGNHPSGTRAAIVLGFAFIMAF